MVDPNAPTAPPSPPPTAAPQSSRPWLDRMRQGNEFDDVRAPSYPYNEIYIDKPGGGYTRLDSYNPDTGEIVSRKLTQLSGVQEQTAVNYVNEIPSKYPIGSTIADVPSSGNLAGETLSGQYILEVPPQTSPVPQSVLDAASEAGVTIRDTNGVTYP